MHNFLPGHQCCRTPKQCGIGESVLSMDHCLHSMCTDIFPGCDTVRNFNLRPKSDPTWVAEEVSDFWQNPQECAACNFGVVKLERIQSCDVTSMLHYTLI
eukprot:scpid104217/ scgid12179/ 